MLMFMLLTFSVERDDMRRYVRFQADQGAALTTVCGGKQACRQISRCVDAGLITEPIQVADVSNLDQSEQYVPCLMFSSLKTRICLLSILRI